MGDHRSLEDSLIREEARCRLVDLERQLDTKSGQLSAQEETFAAERLELSAFMRSLLPKLEAGVANGLVRPRLTSRRRVGGDAKLLCCTGDVMHHGGEISPVAPGDSFHGTCSGVNMVTTDKNKLGVESQQPVSDVGMPLQSDNHRRGLVDTFSRVARPLASAFTLPFFGHRMQPGHEQSLHGLEST